MKSHIAFVLSLAFLGASAPVIGAFNDSTPIGGGWRVHQEFGVFLPLADEDPTWLFLVDHGWLYWLGGSWDDGSYVYARECGWIYAVAGAHPWFWVFERDKWMDSASVRIAPSLYTTLSTEDILKGQTFEPVGRFRSEVAGETTRAMLRFGPQSNLDEGSYVLSVMDTLLTGTWTIDATGQWIDGRSVDAEGLSWNPWAQALWWGSDVINGFSETSETGIKFRPLLEE